MTQTLPDKTPLEDLLSIKPGEVVIGKMVGLDEKGVPLVDYFGNPTQQSVPALTTLPLSQEHLGREVALLFAEGDLKKPVIVGLIHPIVEKAFAAEEQTNWSLEAHLDGQRVILSAQREIVLQCGKASITLTRAGKIIIRGVHILSRASGLNRVKGAAVEIN